MSLAPTSAATIGTAPMSLPPTAGNNVPVPALLQAPPVSGGGPSANLQQALENLWGAVGALKGAIEGAQSISGGGGSASSGCGCGPKQSVDGASKLGEPTQAAAESKADSKPAKPAKPAEAAKPKAAAPADWKAPKGFKIQQPLPGASVTSPFAEVAAIRNNVKHGATDLSMGGANGKPILSAAPGKVLSNSWEPGGGGNYMIIDHGNGWYTGYAHMLEKSPLKPGDVVKAGAPIGKVGSTGNSTGPHLHFEIFKGGTQQSNRIDAQPFLDGKQTFS